MFEFKNDENKKKIKIGAIKESRLVIGYQPQCPVLSKLICGFMSN
jgi:hypothetical protein